MARARNIKPGFYKNDNLAECSVWARYIFPGLWMLADRDGLLQDRPKYIKGELLPFDSQEVEPLLAELAAAKDVKGVPFIIRYENEDGRFIQITGFSKHQNPHYSEKKSVIKPPVFPESAAVGGAPTPGALPDESGKPPENSGNEEALKGGQNGLIPDSLIPDSPIPGSSAALPPEKNEPPASNGPPTIADYANFFTRKGMEALSVMSVKTRAVLKIWEVRGVSLDTLEVAMLAAAQRLGAMPTSPAYLRGIVDDLLREPAGEPEQGNGTRSVVESI